MSDEFTAQCERLIEPLRDQEGALLPILHSLQSHFGHIPASAVPVVARALNLSRAEVHGVISFYRDFHQQPRGERVVRVCRAEACQSLGAEDLARHASERLGLEFGATRDDGSITLEAVYCLGLCACGPAVSVGDSLYGRVGPRRFDELIRP